MDFHLCECASNPRLERQPLAAFEPTEKYLKYFLVVLTGIITAVITLITIMRIARLTVRGRNALLCENQGDRFKCIVAERCGSL